MPFEIIQTPEDERLDFFVAAALTGLLAADPSTPAHATSPTRWLAERSVLIGETVINELELTKEGSCPDPDADPVRIRNQPPSIIDAPLHAIASLINSALKIRRRLATCDLVAHENADITAVHKDAADFLTALNYWIDEDDPTDDDDLRSTPRR